MGFFKKLFTGKENKKPVVKRTLLNLRIGDFLTYYGEDYEVFAVVDWMEQGLSYKEYKLKKNLNESYWMTAEIDDGELLVLFYTIVNDFKTDIPPARKIKFDNEEYELEETGQAVGKLKSNIASQDMKCKYWYYECTSNEEKVFSIEDYSGDFEASYGIKVLESEIDILPGG